MGPLFLQDKKDTKSSMENVSCIICANVYDLNKNLDEYVKHLFEAHDLVIEDVQLIPKLQCYLEYWRTKLEHHDLSAFVPSIKLPESGSIKTYFLISTLLKEDQNLRQKLRLEHAMTQSEWERTDVHFQRACLFCRHVQNDGKRSEYLDHLSEQHNLQLGNAQNLVFIDDLLDVIESKLNAFACIYCEKTFPDRNVLKEHMRKKQHKRINARNRDYDRFFIVTYAIDEDANNAEDCDEGEQRRNADSQYFDWKEEDTLITCLFCPYVDGEMSKICLHMQSAHGFNFPLLAAHLDFYQRVKLVNYLRRCMIRRACPNCEHIDETQEELVDGHMYAAGCFRLPDLQKFDMAMYYFPTYENDAFLLYLEDVDD